MYVLYSVLLTLFPLPSVW